jgi:hypothetical protein
MPTTPVPNILQDPGFIYWAPLGTAIPVTAPVASQFVALPVAWINLGATEDGSQFNYESRVEPVRAAEFLDPIRYATVERSGNMSFTLIDWTLHNMRRVLNAPSSAVTIVSGTGVTQLNAFEPPDPGLEVRCMLAWESLASDVRIYMRQCINSGSIASKFQKAPAVAGFACTFNLEVPIGAKPFIVHTAGTGRVGTP